MGPEMFPPGRYGRSGPRVGGIAGLIIGIVGVVIVLIVVASIHHSVGVSPNGPCIDGPVTGAAGQPIGHGNFRFPCSGGGTTVVHLGN